MPDLDALYEQYSNNPTPNNLDDLLAAVRKQAKLVLRDEDATQDFLIDVWQQLATLKIKTSFRGWLVTKLFWLDIDEHRAGQRGREEQPPVMFDEDEEQMSDEEVLELLHFQHQQRQPKPLNVEDEVESITDPVIRYVADRLLQGWTQAEIAQELGMHPGTLRTRIRRYRIRHKSH